MIHASFNLGFFLLKAFYKKICLQTLFDISLKVIEYTNRHNPIHKIVFSPQYRTLFDNKPNAIKSFGLRMEKHLEGPIERLRTYCMYIFLYRIYLHSIKIWKSLDNHDIYVHMCSLNCKNSDCIFQVC